MNEQIKKLVEEAGWSGIEEIERFAAIVDAAAVAREREACAKLVEEVGRQTAAAIRARGAK